MYVIRLSPSYGEGGGYFNRVKHAPEPKNNRDYNIPVVTDDRFEAKTWKTLDAAKRFAERLVYQIAEPIGSPSNRVVDNEMCNRYNIVVCDRGLDFSVHYIPSEYGPGKPKEILVRHTKYGPVVTYPTFG